MPVEVNSSSPPDATHAVARNFSQSAGCSMEQIFTPINITKGAISSTPGFRPPNPSNNEEGFFGATWEAIQPSSGTEEISYEDAMAQRREDYSNEMKRRADAYQAEMDRRRDFYNDRNSPTPEPEPIDPQNRLEPGAAVGPTISELNPYFSTIFGDDGTSFIQWNDYNVVVHEPTSDLNLKKNSRRQEVSTVRTQALRGPLILSGWGFDIGDLPVPSLFSTTTGGSLYQFDPRCINQRSYWKTGPVHLMWDDQRQVWCGGYQIVCGHLSDDPEDKDSRLDYFEIKAPTDPLYPTRFKVKILRRTSVGVGVIQASWWEPLNSDLGEKITCANRDVDLSWVGEDPKNVFVIAARLNYEWVPIYVRRPTTNIFIGTFSGQWQKGRSKNVTQTRPTPPSNAEPVLVLNLFSDVGGQINDPSPINCAYTKIGNVYYLIAAEC